MAIEGLGDGDLRLRAATAKDVGPVTEICQDPELQRWTRIPSPYGREHAEQFVELHQRSLEDATRGVFVLAVDRATDQVFGSVGLPIDWVEANAGVGYWVAQWARGRGVATRATRLVCHHAFEVLGVPRIELQAAVPNVASNVVAERLGFRHEGVRRAGTIDGPKSNARGPRVDVNVYGLLPGELQ